jgi:hypothetical protein
MWNNKLTRNQRVKPISLHNIRFKNEKIAFLAAVFWKSIFDFKILSAQLPVMILNEKKLLRYFN